MAADLSNTLEYGINNLLTWRDRYSQWEYPYKLAVNIFYRKYTMEKMFPVILGCFSKDEWEMRKTKWPDTGSGFKALNDFYGQTIVYPIL